jgi:hypothetical protein
MVYIQPEKGLVGCSYERQAENIKQKLDITVPDGENESQVIAKRRKEGFKGSRGKSRGVKDTL